MNSLEDLLAMERALNPMTTERLFADFMSTMGIRKGRFTLDDMEANERNLMSLKKYDINKSEYKYKGKIGLHITEPKIVNFYLCSDLKMRWEEFINGTFIHWVLSQEIPTNIPIFYGIGRTDTGPFSHYEYIKDDSYYRILEIISGDYDGDSDDDSDSDDDNSDGGDEEKCCVKQYRLTYQQHCSILKQLCDLLDHLQKRCRFIHGDLKQDNICLSISYNANGDIESIRPYLIDFEFSSFQYPDMEKAHTKPWSFELSEWNGTSKKNELLNGTITDSDMINDPHVFSGDLIYFMLRFVDKYKYIDRDTPEQEQLNDLALKIETLFEAVNKKGKTINLYHRIVKYDYIEWFKYFPFTVSKNSRIMTCFLGDKIDYSGFYARFLPENLSRFFQSEIERTTST